MAGIGTIDTINGIDFMDEKSVSGVSPLPDYGLPPYLIKDFWLFSRITKGNIFL